MPAHFKRIIIWTCVGIVVAIAIGLALRPQPVQVELYALQQEPMRIELNAEGETRVHDVFILSAPVGGLMRRIESHVGDPVTEHETILVSIEPGDPTFLDERSEAQASAAAKAAESARDLASAEVERAKAELDFASSDHERIRNLFAQGTVTRRELDAAERAFKTSRAALATAQAALDVSVYELEQARARLLSPASGRRMDCACIYLTAPVSGTILNIVSESERVVRAGDALLEIGDPANLEIVSDYLSTDAVKIEAGHPVRIDHWGGAQPLAGQVRYVEPSGFTKVSALGIEEQRVNVVIDLTTPADDWRRLGHGYQVETNVIVWEQEETLTIPLTAVFRDGDGGWAAFAEEDGVAVKVQLELGRRNGTVAEVRGGLDQGANVVLHPSDRVKEGVRLRSQLG